MEIYEELGLIQVEPENNIKEEKDMYNPYSTPFYQPYTPPSFNGLPFGGQVGQPMPNTSQNATQSVSQAIEYVNGLEGAKAYLIAPNSTKLLMDSDGNYFYIKTANQQGQATVKRFKYEEVGEEKKEEKPQIDTSKFVKIDDFEKLKKEVASIQYIKDAFTKKGE